MWVEFGVGVGAPHVVGFGGLGEFGRDLMGVGGVYTDKLAFFGKEVGGHLGEVLCHRVLVLTPAWWTVQFQHPPVSHREFRGWAVWVGVWLCLFQFGVGGLGGCWAQARMVGQ